MRPIHPLSEHGLRGPCRIGQTQHSQMPSMQTPQDMKRRTLGHKWSVVGGSPHPRAGRSHRPADGRTPSVHPLLLQRLRRPRRHHHLLLLRSTRTSICVCGWLCLCSLTRTRTVVSAYNPRLFPDVHHSRRQVDKEMCAHFKSDPSVPVHTQGHGQTSLFLSHRETPNYSVRTCHPNCTATNDIFALIIQPGACLDTIRGSILKCHPRVGQSSPK